MKFLVYFEVGFQYWRYIMIRALYSTHVSRKRSTYNIVNSVVCVSKQYDRINYVKQDSHVCEFRDYHCRNFNVTV